MRNKSLMVMALSVFFLASCGTRRLREAESRYSKLDSSYRALQSRYDICQDSSERYVETIKSLNEQIRTQKVSNDQMLNQLKDLSVISSSQAESIKKSLENIGEKDAYIKDLQSAIARKDSLNMALVLNLKGAIGDMDDKDINIKVDKGVVYIDISDKLLFASGKYNVTARAREVLGKVARVLANQPQIEFMVEGHTDNVPYRQGVLLDNWDLSVKRATAIVRILQNQYGIPPARMTAAGRGEYVPIASNDTAEGRQTNRRTRIVILPELDQFFKLLETPQRR
ncbi:MAG TPA: OmpA family protein [Sphingobacteriaceae bacterium]